jgi:hypothetical protein
MLSPDMWAQGHNDVILGATNVGPGAISSCLVICDPRNIVVLGKLAWRRTCHDECIACDSMGVLPAIGTDKHGACWMA